MVLEDPKNILFSQTDFDLVLSIYQGYKPQLMHRRLKKNSPWAIFDHEFPKAWSPKQREYVATRYLPYLFKLEKNHPEVFSAIAPQPPRPVSKRVTKALSHIFFTLLVVLFSEVIALAFLVHAFLEIVERIRYHECWWRALPVLAGIIVGAAIGTCIGMFLIATPMIALGFSLSISPLVLAYVGMVCSAIVSAALGAGICDAATTRWFVRKHQGVVTKLMATDTALPSPQKTLNANSVPPKKMQLPPTRLELGRFELSKSVKQQIKIEGRVVSDVNFMIWFLTKKLDSMPSLFHRFFTQKGQEKQVLLEQIRQLRQGGSKCTIGDHTYDLCSFINSSPGLANGLTQQSTTDSDDDGDPYPMQMPR